MGNLAKEFRLEFGYPQSKESHLLVQRVKRDYQGNIQQMKEGKRVSIDKLASLNIIGKGKPGSKFFTMPQKEHLDKNPQLIKIWEETVDGTKFERMALPISCLEAYGLVRDI